MLRCNEFTDVVTDYLEGPMSLGKKADVFLHLRSCSGCRAYLDQMKATTGLLRCLPPPSRPPILSEALLAYFRRAQLAPAANSDQQTTRFALAD